MSNMNVDLINRVPVIAWFNQQIEHESNEDVAKGLTRGLRKVAFGDRFDEDPQWEDYKEATLYHRTRDRYQCLECNNIYDFDFNAELSDFRTHGVFCCPGCGRKIVKVLEGPDD